MLISFFVLCRFNPFHYSAWCKWPVSWFVIWESCGFWKSSTVFRSCRQSFMFGVISHIQTPVQHLLHRLLTDWPPRRFTGFDFGTAFRPFCWLAQNLIGFVLPGCPLCRSPYVGFWRLSGVFKHLVQGSRSFEKHRLRLGSREFGKFFKNFPQMLLSNVAFLLFTASY